MLLRVVGVDHLMSGFAEAISEQSGTWLLDRTSDPDHARSVFTFAGYPGRAMAAMRHTVCARGSATLETRLGRRTRRLRKFRRENLHRTCTASCLQEPLARQTPPRIPERSPVRSRVFR